MILLEREKRRTCQECKAGGDTLLLTFGGVRMRACHNCWEKVSRLRYKLAAENLDSVEAR